MSTEIKSTATSRTLTIFDNLDGDMFLRIRLNSMEEAAIYVDRADLIAAVATECDVIIVRRAELPEVEENTRPFGERSVGGLVAAPRTTADEARENAREWLALAEHLDAHPPVDEAQVEALKLVIWGLPISLDAGELARTLIATGKVTVTR